MIGGGLGKGEISQGKLGNFRGRRVPIKHMTLIKMNYGRGDITGLEEITGLTRRNKQ